MLRLGVIEPSISAWHSPILLVPKPDNSIWFCIDFREVNKVASFNTYPITRVDILLSQLGEASYMSALDLTKGYWQIPLQSQHRKKTAFATPKILFQFVTGTRCPDRGHRTTWSSSHLPMISKHGPQPIWQFLSLMGIIADSFRTSQPLLPLSQIV